MLKYLFDPVMYMALHMIDKAVNTLRPRQHGCHFADDTLKRIFLNKKLWISIKISLKFVPKSPVDNIPALFQIMAWRRPGDKPLSEAMMVSLLTHICVAWPQWVNTAECHYIYRVWYYILFAIQQQSWRCWSQKVTPCASPHMGKLWGVSWKYLRNLTMS